LDRQYLLRFTSGAPSTLLSLVSEQRMQNIIPLFQRGLRFDQVILLASARQGDTAGVEVNPRFARIAGDLAAALDGRAGVTLWPRAVDPMLPDSTASACAEIATQLGGAATQLGGSAAVTINFTGGTKPMSIGAYQAGLASGAPMLYVDTQQEQILHFAGGAARAEPFALEPIRVAQMLAAHGKPINPSWTHSKQPSAAEEEITRELFARRPGSIGPVLAAQTLLRAQPADADHEKFLPAAGADWLADALVASGLARPEGAGLRVCMTGLRYLDGGWLEQYVLLVLQRDGRFADVAGNVQLSGIENELDAACTFNGKLGIVECKSGKIEGGVGSATTNRLRALKESLAGTFGKTILVACTPNADMPRRFLDRAREYVSCVAGLEDLGRVEGLIYDAIAARSR
jgi:hypothetical protein